MITQQEYQNYLQEMHLDLLELIKKLSPEYLQKQHPKFISPLSDIRPLPVIGFIGGFSVGKSTTINQILRGTLEDKSCMGNADLTLIKKILEYDLTPVDVLPTTVCGLHFRYGKQFEATFFSDKERTFLSEAHKITDLQKYLEIVSYRPNLVSISFIELRIPHPFLQKYCELMDMPGHNSIMTDDKQKLSDMVFQCDGLIYLLGQRGISNEDASFLKSILQPIIQVNDNNQEILVRRQFQGPVSFWINLNEPGSGNPQDVLRYNEQKIKALLQPLNSYFIKRIFGGVAPVHCFDSFNTLKEEMEHFYQYLIYFSYVAIVYHIDSLREAAFEKTYNINQRLCLLFQGQRSFSLTQKTLRSEMPNPYIRPLLVLYQLKKISERIETGERFSFSQIRQTIEEKMGIMETASSKSEVAQDYAKRITLLAKFLYELKQIQQEQGVLRQMEEIYPEFQQKFLGNPTSINYQKRTLLPMPISKQLQIIEGCFQKDSYSLGLEWYKKIDKGKISRKQNKFIPLSEQEKMEQRTTKIKQQLHSILEKLQKLYNEQSNHYRFCNITPSFCRNASEELEKNRYLLPVCGSFSSGKSTFLNALLDNNGILPVADTPTTAYITELHYNEQPYAELQWRRENKITLFRYVDNVPVGRELPSVSLELCLEELDYLRQLLQDNLTKTQLPKIKSCKAATISNPHPHDYDGRKILKDLNHIQDAYCTEKFEFRTPKAKESSYQKAIDAFKNELCWEDPIEFVYLEFEEKPNLKMSLASEKEIQEFAKYHGLYFGFLIEKAKVFWNLSMLRDICLVDTPGFHSLISTHDAVTEDYMVHCSSFIFLMTASQALNKEELGTLKKICLPFQRRKKEGRKIPSIFIVITKMDCLSVKQAKQSPRNFVKKYLEEEFADLKDHFRFHEISTREYTKGCDDKQSFKNLIYDISQALCESDTYRRIQDNDFILRDILEKEIHHAKKDYDRWQEKNKRYVRPEYKEDNEALQDLEEQRSCLIENLQENQKQKKQQQEIYQSLQQKIENLFSLLENAKAEFISNIDYLSDEQDFIILRDGCYNPKWWQWGKSRETGTAWGSYLETLQQKISEHIQRSCKISGYMSPSVLPELPRLNSAEIRNDITRILESCRKRNWYTLWLTKSLEISDARSRLKERIRQFMQEYQSKTREWVSQVNSIIAQIATQIQDQYQREFIRLQEQKKEYDGKIDEWHKVAENEKHKAEQIFSNEKQKCIQEIYKLEEISTKLQKIQQVLLDGLH